MFYDGNEPLNDVNGYSDYMVDEASLMKHFDYQSIYRSKEFNEAMTYFDITDNKTRGILLSVNEADQNLIMQNLASKLYQHIVNKVDDIDFGTIPNSRGDITKIDNYEQLKNCVAVIGEILRNYKQSTEPIDIIEIAMQNITDRRELFTRAYKLNIEMPIIIYNTTVLSIVSSVSYMISTCIEFIKLPDNKGFEIALDKTAKIKTKDHTLFKSLIHFNSSCAKGEFDKCMDFVIKNNLTMRESMLAEDGIMGKFSDLKNRIGDYAALHPGAKPIITGGIIVAASAAIILAIIGIIKAIRAVIYYHYYAKAKVSDYFDEMSALLMMNAYNIENDLTRDETARKNIADKQQKIADIFKRLSNKLKVDDKTGSSKGSKEEEKSDKEKYKYKDISDQTPASADVALF